jgi:hypothetical protein
LVRQSHSFWNPEPCAAKSKSQNNLIFSKIQPEQLPVPVVFLGPIRCVGLGGSSAMIDGGSRSASTANGAEIFTTGHGDGQVKITC